MTAATNRYNVSVTGSGSKTLAYDPNGNLTDDGAGQTYEWDGANRLVAINYTGTTNRTELSYDGLNRLVKIVEKTGTTINSTSKFVWVGSDKCEVRNANDGVSLRVYAQGEFDSGTAYFYTRDHLGSVREMFKSDGTILARYDYDPWGRTNEIINTRKPHYNFTGLYRHPRSDLVFAAYRAYDPSLGRWLSRDPIGEAGETAIPHPRVANPQLVFNALDPIQRIRTSDYRTRIYAPQVRGFLQADPVRFVGRDVNLYGYVWNEPTRLADPEGLDADTDARCLDAAIQYCGNNSNCVCNVFEKCSNGEWPNPLSPLSDPTPLSPIPAKTPSLWDLIFGKIWDFFTK